MNIQKKPIEGIAYTPSGNFIILQKIRANDNPHRMIAIGSPLVKEVDLDTETYTYPEPQILHIVGDHVYMEFDQVKEAYFYISEEKNGKKNNAGRT